MKLIKKVLTCVNIALAAAALCITSACSEPSEITTYFIPKEKKGQKGGKKAESGTATLHWTIPDGWEAGKPSTMRLGSYLVEDANGSSSIDISIIAFPGLAGGLLANVNRWLEEINIKPIENSNLDEYVSEIQVAGGPAKLVKAENGGVATHAVILQGEDKTWFFKLKGDAKLAKLEEANFTQFIESVHFSDDHEGHDH